MSNFLLLTIEWLEKLNQQSDLTLEQHNEQVAVRSAHIHEMINFLSQIEPSQLKSVLKQNIHSQIEQLKKAHTITENFYKQLSLVYRYFHNLHFELQRQLERTEQAGSIFAASQLLAAQFNPELYDDPSDDMENIHLTARFVLQGLAERIRLYCELAVGILYRTFPEGDVSFFPSQRQLHSCDREALEQTVYTRSQTELMQHSQRSRARSLSSASLVTSVSETRSNMTSLHAVPLSFKKKWQLLPRSKKCIFIGLLFLEFVVIATTAVFVPGLALVTIPAAGVLTAKVLAALISSLVLIASVAAELRHVHTQQYIELKTAAMLDKVELKKEDVKQHHDQTGLSTV